MKKPSTPSRPIFLDPPLFFFAFAFFICVIGGEWACHLGLGWRGLPSSTPVDFDKTVLDEFSFYQPDFYYMLYQGIGKPLSFAQHADILLLGNSRLLFALRDDSIQKFEAQTGLRVFNMALNLGDRYPLALEIIKRHHIHPALVIINEDDFFRYLWTGADMDTRQSDYWQSLFKLQEHRFSWEIGEFLHEWIPKFHFFAQNPSESMYLLRSVETGGIVFENSPRRHYPCKQNGHGFFYRDYYQKCSKDFKAEADQLGLNLLLTFVPGESNPNLVENMSRFLKVPALQVKVAGLETFDHSHLTPESADRFAAAFFQRLASSKEVRALILDHEKTRPSHRKLP